MQPGADPSTTKSRIAIVGGGITGLSAAHRLHELAPNLEVTLLEATTRCGGSLHTIDDDGFRIELGADSFSTKIPAALELVRRLDWEQELITTESANRRALVLCRGKPVAVPDGFVIMAPRRLGPLLRSPILSPLGKLRVLCEPWIARRESSEDMSVADFARRRLGSEAYRRLIQPLFGGIYTGDPELLSLKATAYQFWEWEQQHGSLIRGATRVAASRRGIDRDDAVESGARYSQFVTPRRGMGSLIDHLVASVPPVSVAFGTSVGRITRAARGQWHLEIVGETAEEVRHPPYDAVVVTTPPAIAAALVDDAEPSLSGLLATIDSAGAVVVTLGYDRRQVGHPLDAFGMVVPMIERRQILAVSFASVKFPLRAPPDRVLLRVFLGGALQPELLELDDKRLVEIAEREVSELLNVAGQAAAVHVARWSGAMPQYHVGHLDLVARIESRVAMSPGLELAGNAYHGVGIAQCVRSGIEAADRVLGYITSPRRRKPR